MTAVVISVSADRSWVKPLATLRARGVACVVVSLDVASFEQQALEDETPYWARPAPPLPQDHMERRSQERRALRYALAEFDIPMHTLTPARRLGELLVG
jgi:hypothetical protein